LTWINGFDRMFHGDFLISKGYFVRETSIILSYRRKSPFLLSTYFWALPK